MLELTLTNLNISHSYEKSSMKMTGSISASSLYFFRKSGCSIKILSMGIVFSRIICIFIWIPHWGRIVYWVRWTSQWGNRWEILLSLCLCNGWLFVPTKIRECFDICRCVKIMKGSRCVCLRIRNYLNLWGSTWEGFQDRWEMLLFHKNRNCLFSALHEDSLNNSKSIVLLLCV